MIPVPFTLRGVGPNGERVGDPYPKCDYCGETNGVFWRAAHTAYSDYYPEYTVFDFIIHDDTPPLPPDPNPPKPLCEECEGKEKEFWDDMWRVYYHDQM